jgi:hypothetical protein
MTFMKWSSLQTRSIHLLQFHIGLSPGLSMIFKTKLGFPAYHIEIEAYMVETQSCHADKGFSACQDKVRLLTRIYPEYLIFMLEPVH